MEKILRNASVRRLHELNEKWIEDWENAQQFTRARTDTTMVKFLANSMRTTAEQRPNLWKSPLPESVKKNLDRIWAGGNECFDRRTTKALKVLGWLPIDCANPILANLPVIVTLVTFVFHIIRMQAALPSNFARHIGWTIVTIWAMSMYAYAIYYVRGVRLVQVTYACATHFDTDQPTGEMYEELYGQPFDAETRAMEDMHRATMRSRIVTRTAFRTFMVSLLGVAVLMTSFILGSSPELEDDLDPLGIRSALGDGLYHTLVLVAHIPLFMASCSPWLLCVSGIVLSTHMVAMHETRLVRDVELYLEMRNLPNNERRMDSLYKLWYERSRTYQGMAKLQRHLYTLAWIGLTSATVAVSIWFFAFTLIELFRGTERESQLRSILSGVQLGLLIVVIADVSGRYFQSSRRQSLLAYRVQELLYVLHGHLYVDYNESTHRPRALPADASVDMSNYEDPVSRTIELANIALGSGSLAGSQQASSTVLEDSREAESPDADKVVRSSVEVNAEDRYHASISALNSPSMISRVNSTRNDNVVRNVFLRSEVRQNDLPATGRNIFRVLFQLYLMSVPALLLTLGFSFVRLIIQFPRCSVADRRLGDDPAFESCSTDATSFAFVESVMALNIFLPSLFLFLTVNVFVRKDIPRSTYPAAAVVMLVVAVIRLSYLLVKREYDVVETVLFGNSTMLYVLAVVVYVVRKRGADLRKSMQLYLALAFSVCITFAVFRAFVQTVFLRGSESRRLLVVLLIAPICSLILRQVNIELLLRVSTFPTISKYLFVYWATNQLILAIYLRMFVFSASSLSTQTLAVLYFAALEVLARLTAPWRQIVIAKITGGRTRVGMERAIGHCRSRMRATLIALTTMTEFVSIFFGFFYSIIVRAFYNHPVRVGDLAVLLALQFTAEVFSDSMAMLMELRQLNRNYLLFWLGNLKPYAVFVLLASVPFCIISYGIGEAALVE